MMKEKNKYWKKTKKQRKNKRKQIIRRKCWKKKKNKNKKIKKYINKVTKNTFGKQFGVNCVPGFCF